MAGIKILSRRALFAAMLQKCLPEVIDDGTDTTVIVVDFDTHPIPLVEPGAKMKVVCIAETPKPGDDIIMAFRAGVSAYLLCPSIKQIIGLIDFLLSEEGTLHTHNHTPEAFEPQRFEAMARVPMVPPIQVGGPVTFKGTPRDLSPSEMQILHHLASGATNKVIARAVGCIETTVKVHCKAIYRKLGLRNRTEACAWYVAGGHRLYPQLTAEEVASS